MGLFGRLFKVAESEAHSVVDKLEDPIKLTEQGIRDLKEDLDKSIKALAEVKAAAIRSKREAEEYRRKSADYERKAMAIIGKAQAGEISEADADRLASEALSLKEQNDSSLKSSMQEVARFDQNVNKLEGSIRNLRSNISKYENEAKTLKARAKVSEATKRVNKQLASVDSSSTVNMLERMKERVETQEAESDAYLEIAGENRSLDDEIDSVLDAPSTQSDALAALKAKMLAPKEPPKLEDI